MKKILIILSLTVLLGINTVPLYAADSPAGQYKLLVGLPGVGNSGDTVTFEKYLPALFRLSIGLCFVLAVIMIILGGVQYMSTDAISGKSAGRERIQSALLGLLLVLSAYLILQTIDPDLVAFKVLNDGNNGGVPNIEKTTSGSSGTQASNPGATSPAAPATPPDDTGGDDSGD